MVLQQRGSHLRSAGVVHADEEHRGLARGLARHGQDPCSAKDSCGTTSSGAATRDAGTSATATATPIAAPMTWATTKPGTDRGAMPAKVSVNARPVVTAGFAK